MKTFLLGLALLGSACTHRALDLPFDGAAHDLAVDAALDLAGDLAGDMARPHYCNGIYVIGRDQLLSFFDPVKLTFTPIGTISCSSGPGTGPFSMALARDGTAWVVYDDGELFNVDTDTAACTPTAYVAGQHGFGPFGMGFASDAAGSTTETLFVDSDEQGERLGRIDTTTLALSVVGALGTRDNGELTGTGSGELWGFFRGAPAHIGRIDKSTAVVAPEVPLPMLGDVSAAGFAFGFFAGSFYAFLYDDTESTKVARIDAATGTAELVLSNTGLQVVGAGVSTCAPTQ